MMNFLTDLLTVLANYTVTMAQYTTKGERPVIHRSIDVPCDDPEIYADCAYLIQSCYDRRDEKLLEKYKPSIECHYRNGKKHCVNSYWIKDANLDTEMAICLYYTEK